LVKLILPEPSTRALMERLGPEPRVISCALSRVEVARTVRRTDDAPSFPTRMGEVMGQVHMVRPEERVLRLASELEPSRLRSLDSMHLASALSLGEAIDVFITYDRQLGAAARASGLVVEAPGAV